MDASAAARKWAAGAGGAAAFVGAAVGGAGFVWSVLVGLGGGLLVGALVVLLTTPQGQAPAQPKAEREAAPEPKRERVPEPEPEAKQEPEPEPEPEPEAKQEQEPEPEPGRYPTRRLWTRPKREPEPEPEPEPEAKQEPEPKPEPEPEATQRPEPGRYPTRRLWTRPKRKPEPEPERAPKVEHAAAASEVVRFTTAKRALFRVSASTEPSRVRFVSPVVREVSSADLPVTIYFAGRKGTSLLTIKQFFDDGFSIQEHTSGVEVRAEVYPKT